MYKFVWLKILSRHHFFFSLLKNKKWERKTKKVQEMKENVHRESLSISLAINHQVFSKKKCHVRVSVTFNIK